jgi:hypothetical protein
MRYGRVFVSLAFLLASAASGRQSAPAPSQNAQNAGTQAQTEPLEIWQIDLVPSGSGFALTKPVLEGDVYVFKVWPDRSIVRLPKSKVKQMIPRTKDVSGEVLYKIDLAPTGQMIARDAPTLKGTTYRFHSWKEGTLMSLRQSDVQKITKVTGMDAFKIHMEQLGAKRIGNLPMEGGGSAQTVGGAPAAAAEAAAPAGVPPQTPYNWVYWGVPGVTEAWAPAAAVQNAPGDVPRAPEPQPH